MFLRARFKKKKFTACARPKNFTMFKKLPPKIKKNFKNENID